MQLYRDIEIKRIDDSTNIVYIPWKNKYIKMGNKEVRFLESFNINKKQEQCETDDFMSEETKRFMIEKFREMELIGENQLKIKEKKGIQERLKNIDISKLKIISFNPENLLEMFSPLTNKIFTPTGGVGVGVLFLVAIIILIRDSEKIKNILSGIGNMTIIEMVLLYIMTLLGMALHEFSHGLACKRFGGRVNKMGIMLFYLQPAAYCDVSGLYLLDKNYKKIITLLSGIVSQWVVSSLIIILYSILSSFGYSINVLIYYAVLNIGISIVNFIPFIKLDGYWILSTIMNVYNLREKSFEYLMAILTGKFKFIIKKEKCGLVIFYGIISLIFTGYLWEQVSFKLIVLIKPLVNTNLYNIIVIIIVSSIFSHLFKLILQNFKSVKKKYTI